MTRLNYRPSAAEIAEFGIKTRAVKSRNNGLGVMPKKWQVNISEHADFAKIEKAYFNGDLTNEELMAAFRKMKMDLVKPGYFEYSEKKHRRELNEMFG